MKHFCTLNDYLATHHSIENRVYEEDEDTPIQSGDVVRIKSRDSWAMVDYVTEDSVVVMCSCGQCTLDDRTEPRANCQRMKELKYYLN